MAVEKLPNGNLIIPRRAIGDGITGDGVEEITPDHPDYDRWHEHYELSLKIVAAIREIST